MTDRIKTHLLGFKFKRVQIKKCGVGLQERFNRKHLTPC
jgi:hypothetical protein